MDLGDEIGCLTVKRLFASFICTATRIRSVVFFCTHVQRGNRTMLAKPGQTKCVDKNLLF